MKKAKELLLGAWLAYYRPDVYRLMQTPEVRVEPGAFTHAIPRKSVNRTLSEWFSNQSQDRSLLTVYRGMVMKDGPYDPEYQFKAGLPVPDPRVFTSADLAAALGYATKGDRPGLVLRLEMPRFLLYEKKPGPYGLVYFRDLVPNDLPFVTGIAFARAGENPVFLPLAEALPKLGLKMPLPEERLNADGTFRPTRAWVDAICAGTRRDCPALYADFLSQTKSQCRRAEEMWRTLTAGEP